MRRTSNSEATAVAKKSSPKLRYSADIEQADNGGYTVKCRTHGGEMYQEPTTTVHGDMADALHAIATHFGHEVEVEDEGDEDGKAGKKKS